MLNKLFILILYLRPDDAVCGIRRDPFHICGLPPKNRFSFQSKFFDQLISNNCIEHRVHVAVVYGFQLFNRI